MCDFPADTLNVHAMYVEIVTVGIHSCHLRKYAPHHAIPPEVLVYQTKGA